MRMFALVVVVCSVLIAVSCQTKPAEPARARAQPPYTTTATIKDIMLHIVDPAGDMVWDSVSTIIDKGGIHETVPKTDEEWNKVRNGVITLIEASNLLMVPGRAMARPGEKSVAPGVELEPAEMEELVKKDPRGLAISEPGHFTTSASRCSRSSTRRTPRSCSTSARTSTGRARTATGSTGIPTRRSPISRAR